MGLANFILKSYAALKSNRFDNDQIERLQQERLQRLLSHAATNSEFYNKLYDGINITKCRLKDLPVVTKSTMMDNFDRFVTDKRLKLREIQDWRHDKNNDGKMYLGEFIPIYTSGSSGKTALIIYSRKAMEQVQASLFVRASLTHTKRPFCDLIKVLAQLLLGRKIRMAAIVIPRGNMYPIFNIASPLQNLFVKSKILSALDPIPQKVDELNEFQPDCLISDSPSIASLAQEQLSGRLNIKFGHPKSFVAAGGQPLTKQTQQLAMRAWNKKVLNIYGSTECFTMATSCQAFDRLHVMSDLCIIEIVDRDFNPVPKGQFGEKLLLTNLFNFVQPIIRYEIGDVTGYSNHNCECGITLPTLLPVHGRTTDFVYYKNLRGGYEKFHPYFLVVPLFYLNDLQQYQIVQTARNELTVYYVPQKNAVDIKQRLSHTMREALVRSNLERHINLKYEQVESVSRDKGSQKFKIIISMGAPETEKVQK